MLTPALLNGSVASEFNKARCECPDVFYVILIYSSKLFKSISFGCGCWKKQAGAYSRSALDITH